MCKVRDPKLMQQQMAKLPTDRLQTSPPFSKIMLDYLSVSEVRYRKESLVKLGLFASLIYVPELYILNQSMDTAPRSLC